MSHIQGVGYPVYRTGLKVYTVAGANSSFLWSIVFQLDKYLIVAHLKRFKVLIDVVRLTTAIKYKEANCARADRPKF